MIRTAAVLLSVLALAGCAERASRGDPRLEDACRVAADRVYDFQHRGDIYSGQTNTNTPSSGIYAPGGNTQALGHIFARDNMIRDCVRHGGEAAPAPAPQPAAR
jgi:hypothetical protein